MTRNGIVFEKRKLCHRALHIQVNCHTQANQLLSNYYCDKKKEKNRKKTHFCELDGQCPKSFNSNLIDKVVPLMCQPLVVITHCCRHSFVRCFSPIALLSLSLFLFPFRSRDLRISKFRHINFQNNIDTTQQQQQQQLRNRQLSKEH